MAVASRKATLGSLLRNWVIVYLGNFVGSIATAVFITLSGQYTMNGSMVGVTAIKIADYKCSLDFSSAFYLAIYCNVLVCLAVWLTMGARTIPGKITAIIFPITAFIAGGFEHCVANMYLIPMGLLIKKSAATGAAAPLADAIASATHLSWERFIG